MTRQIRVKAIRREQPDVRLYVLALLALAQQLQEEERQASEPAEARHPDGSGEVDHA